MADKAVQLLFCTYTPGWCKDTSMEDSQKHGRSLSGLRSMLSKL